MAMTAVAAAAVVTAGVSVYSAATAPGPPDIPAPPPPASYYSYDENGNPAGQQVWDAAQNAYVYKPAPLTDAQKADLAQRQEIRNKMLANINQTPEDRVKAYDEYAKTFSDVMHTDVDKRYTERRDQISENMNSRGLFGSKAYVDSMTQLNQDKNLIDTDIAQKAALAKEQLAQQDQDSYLRTLAQLDAGTKTDALIASQKANTAAQGATAGTAAIMGAANLNSNNILKSWDIESQNNRANTKNYNDSASGLAYLYGYTKNSKAPATPGGAPV